MISVVALFCALAGVGVWLISGPSGADQARVSLGSGLITGAVIGVVIFVGESIRDARFMEHGNRQAFILSVALAKDLSSADLSNRDLRGLDMRGRNLRNANLRSARLEGVNLSGADLRGADLRGANLSSTNLSSADLRLANVSGANLDGCWMVWTDVRGANFQAASLRACIVQAVIAGPPLSITELVELTRIEVVHATAIHGVRFSLGSTRVDATPTRPQFANFMRADFSGSDLTAASFEGATLREANLRFTQISATANTRSQVEQEGLWRPLWWTIRRNPFGYVQTPRAGIPGVPLIAASFKDADLSEANLGFAAAAGAVFSNEQMTTWRVGPLVGGRVDQAPESGDADAVSELKGGEPPHSHSGSE